MNKTIEFAMEAHKDQTRKNFNLPYIVHPLAVYKTLLSIGVTDKDILQAAILHDVLEDTETSYIDLFDLFGEKVANYVLELTSDESVYKFHHNGEFIVDRNKKAEYLTNKMNNMSNGALLCKLADRLDNISDLSLMNNNWSEKYYYETDKIMNRLFPQYTTDTIQVLIDMICNMLDSYDMIYNILDQYEMEK